MPKIDSSACNPKEYWPTKYWHVLSDGRVQCDLCPRYCKLREGKRGACFIRMHQDDGIVLTSFGKSSGFCIDPIEKKPLNHFYPGSKVLSFGTAGCNLSCKFCQNWDISKSRAVEDLSQRATPEDIVNAAQKHGCKSIAFTYNDPVIFLEYAIATSKLAKKAHIKSVAVTAGYINDEPRREFFSNMDAVNLDLKAFTNEFYKSLCHGELKPVLETLKYIKHETRCHLEITTLLIPNHNDKDHQLHAMCEWLATHCGVNTPLHFTAFHPDFKMLETASTPKSTLIKAKDIAQSYGHKFVYIGNVHDEKHQNTYCPECHKLLIKRDWYQLSEYHITESGTCQYCQSKISGQFGTFNSVFGRKRIPIKIS